MAKLVRKACPVLTIKHNLCEWSESLGKIKWNISFVIPRLKGLVNKLGHLLTLAASIGLWFGIYAAISVTIQGEGRLHIDDRVVDEKIDADEHKINPLDIDSERLVLLD